MGTRGGSDRTGNPLPGRIEYSGEHPEFEHSRIYSAHAAYRDVRGQARSSDGGGGLIWHYRASSNGTTSTPWDPPYFRSLIRCPSSPMNTRYSPLWLPDSRSWDYRSTSTRTPPGSCGAAPCASSTIVRSPGLLTYLPVSTS